MPVNLHLFYVIRDFHRRSHPKDIIVKGVNLPERADLDHTLRQVLGRFVRWPSKAVEIHDLPERGPWKAIVRLAATDISSPVAEVVRLRFSPPPPEVSRLLLLPAPAGLRIKAERAWW